MTAEQIADALAEPFEAKYVELPEFPGYRFGDDGSVWSRWQRGRWRQLKGEFHRHKTPPDNHGYQQVNLTDAGGHKRHVKVHKVIALAFHGPCPDGLICRHRDGDQSNNRADNLRYGTYAENSKDTVEHRRTIRGERSPSAKLTWPIVRAIRSRCSAGEKQNAIAREHGVSTTVVSAIVNNKAWVPFEGQDHDWTESGDTVGTAVGPV